MLAGLIKTNLVFIPKKTRLEGMAEYRPIALCNVLYKIISNVLVNRLKGLLGHHITDNFMVTFEVLHFMKQVMRRSDGFVVLKLNMSKAYDWVEWGFLFEIMRRLGFCEGWVGLVWACISTVSYSILFNGDESTIFHPTRGIWQGDHISPYLFILIVEGLSAMIRFHEEVGSLHGVVVARGAPTVSHLFIVDDSYLLFKANCGDSEVVMEILETYARATGQSVNYGKSDMSFSRNMGEGVREVIGRILGARESVGLGNYLGLPMLIGCKKVAISGYIRERITRRIMGWKNKFLSKAGREVILKTTVQALPSYAMQVLLLPKALRSHIEALMNSYWLGCTDRGGKGIRWKSWSRLCMPKQYDGLGFRQL